MEQWATDLAAIADGFSQITIGRSNGTGNININSNLNFSDPILLRSPGGQVNINATVNLIDNTQLNFSASSPARLNTGGAIMLNANEQIANTADFNLNGGTFTFGGFDETLDLLQLSGNSTIDFGNGDSDIAFSSSSGQTWAGLLTINNWSNASGETRGTTNVTEGGATDSYTVVLTSQPTSDVVIALNTGTQLSGSPTSLTFTSANWNVAQTVTVTAVDDTVAEGAHTGTIAPGDLCEIRS